jgi:hypothetical protein
LNSRYGGPRNLWPVLVAVLCLGACAGSSHGPLIDRTAFHPNINSFTTPLDSYVVSAIDNEYARNIVYVQCMATHGYSMPLENPHNFLAPANNSEGGVEFTVSLAQHYGYHTGPVRGGPSMPLGTSLTGNKAKASIGCGKTAQQKIGEDIQLDNWVRGLASGADDATLADPVYKAAVARWRRCMLPLGLPDLPSDPNQMPSPSQHRRFFTGGDVATSPTEIRQAVFDARCRETSGYAVTYYRTEIKHQWALMDQNVVKLGQALDAKNRATANIRRILQQHGS